MRASEAANEAAQLIERYKVFDLWPCSQQELLIYGLSDHQTFQTQNISNSTSKSEVVFEAAKDKIMKKPTNMVTPDVAQMTPFKPTFNWFPGEHRVPGGVFPLPPLAADLCTKLPPPRCFEGPYVILDTLVKALTNANLTKLASVNNGDSAGEYYFYT